MPQGVMLVDENNNPIGGTGNAVLTGVKAARPSASFSRPANATQYTGRSGVTLGDMVANSATAASVIPMTFSNCGQASRGGKLYRASIVTNDTTSTRTTNASFTLHLFSAMPT